MALLNPNDNELAQTLAGSSQQVTNLGLATQPNYIQWLALNPGEVAYSSATVVTVTNDDRFKIGDGIRIKQSDSASYKYFVVTDNTSATQIKISGVDDYTFTNTTIQEFYTSGWEKPVDFPGSFDYTPSISFINITGGSASGETGIWSMVGDHLLYRGQASISWTGSAPGPEIHISTPFEIDALASYDDSGTIYGICLITSGVGRTFNIDKDTISLVSTTSAPFVGGGAGSGNIFWNIII